MLSLLSLCGLFAIIRAGTRIRSRRINRISYGAHRGLRPHFTVLALWAEAEFGTIEWVAILVFAVLAEAERARLHAELLEILARCILVWIFVSDVLNNDFENLVVVRISIAEVRLIEQQNMPVMGDRY